ncbi:hypothetical protein BDD12DRAFT_873311 [Trichophaea hybrida]|nr:hypothetical protein BDD12DRAFT_873311 [Trichophaea hybrida]
MPTIRTRMLVLNQIVNLLRGAFEEEVNDFPDQNNVIFSEFTNKIIAMAQDLSGWHVALRKEKEFVAIDLRQPVSGKGSKERTGLNGCYSQHMSEVYHDPEKGGLDLKRAEEINEEGRVGPLTLLKSIQKKSLNRLTKFLHKLAVNEVYLILIDVP